MDLLEQYKQQRPEAFKEKPRWQPPQGYSEHGFLIRLVMRLSVGKIRDPRRANMILLVCFLGIVAVTLAVLAANSNFLPTRRFSEEDAQKQLEEYRNVQPF